MKVIVIPGTGDPFTHYKEAYELIANEAYLRGTEIKILNFPGHFSFDNNSFMEVDKCIESFRKSFMQMDENEDKYILLCRSFGCQVFVKALTQTTIPTRNIHRVILWGALPFYNLYKILVKDFEQTSQDCLSKGTRIQKNLFYEMYPIELGINEIGKNIDFNILITSGADDENYPLGFHNYLKENNTNEKIIFTDPIEGIGHTVLKNNKDYFDLIFQK